MFKRVIYEDWASIVPIISFILTFGVFAIATLRALCLPKHRCDDLAGLPLEDLTPKNPN
jgi:hypothetical protein